MIPVKGCQTNTN